jgi:mono/diheme cytochrome c family protein
LESHDEAPMKGDPRSTLMLVLSLAVLIGLGWAAYTLLKSGPGPGVGAGGPSIGDDPLLLTGRTIYESRCVSCHGPAGKGDGPVAKTLGAPPPGDLTDDEWKHGDRPEQVVGVIAKGLPGTGMSPWIGTLDEEEIRGVAAFVYHLSGRAVPEELRQP